MRPLLVGATLLSGLTMIGVLAGSIVGRHAWAQANPVDRTIEEKGRVLRDASGLRPRATPHMPVPILALPPGVPSCWHPGLPRNIGIAELSCDFFLHKQETR